MDLAEYKSHGNDVPVKDYLLRRAFGSWNRVISVMNKRYPVSVAPVEVEKPKAAPKSKKAEVKVEKEMANKIFHWTNTFKTLGETDDGGIDIKGSASTNALDRAGDIIEAEAWTKGGLENFKNNPVLLFNHDYNRPIGRATGLEVTDKGLEISGRISKASGEIKDLVKDGVLGAFSVGFRVKDADYMTETDGYKIKDAELFEVSVVSVPCNQGATFSLAKSFDTMEDYEKFKKQFIKANSVDTADAVKVEQPSGEKSQNNGD